ncbi:MAG: hypothetical protein LBE25_05215 [Arthrobacter sp.]|jgi:hypothetical protein|nr:hypothetical protein [Arthrobacter sp.]
MNTSRRTARAAAEELHAALGERLELLRSLPSAGAEQAERALSPLESRVAAVRLPLSWREPEYRDALARLRAIRDELWDLAGPLMADGTHASDMPLRRGIDPRNGTLVLAAWMQAALGLTGLGAAGGWLAWWLGFPTWAGAALGALAGLRLAEHVLRPRAEHANAAGNLRRLAALEDTLRKQASRGITPGYTTPAVLADLRGRWPSEGGSESFDVELEHLASAWERPEEPRV